MFKAVLESVGHEIPPTFSCGIIHAEELFIRLILLEKIYFAQDIEVSSLQSWNGTFP